jgi:hypothetical protein
MMMTGDTGNGLCLQSTFAVIAVHGAADTVSKP